MADDGYELEQHVVEQGMQVTFYDVNSTVGKDLASRGKRGEAVAKRLVPKKTRALEATIYSAVLGQNETLRLELGARSSIALLVHEGSRPHEIIAEHGHALRFTGRGGVYYARHVHHPGTRGVPFLRDAIPEMIR